MQKQVYDLEQRIEEQSSKSLEGLAQGEDEIKIKFRYSKIRGGPSKNGEIKLTWNHLFSKTCTLLMDEANEIEFRDHIEAFIRFVYKGKNDTVYDLYIVTDEFKAILIQFKALGLIESSIKKRSLRDKNSYWKLTARGDKLLTELRAIKRKEKGD